MKILGSPGSPYVRKVRIVALEKRLPFDFQRINLLDPNSELSGANPLGKIPALIRDNGKALYDSSVIAEYLDGLTPSPRLIPGSLEDRAEVKRWEAVADGVMDATVAISHDYILSDVEGGGLAWSNANQQRKIDLGLSVMERDLGTRDYCHEMRSRWRTSLASWHWPISIMFCRRWNGGKPIPVCADCSIAWKHATRSRPPGTNGS